MYAEHPLERLESSFAKARGRYTVRRGYPLLDVLRDDALTFLLVRAHRRV